MVPVAPGGPHPAPAAAPTPEHPIVLWSPTKGPVVPVEPPLMSNGATGHYKTILADPPWRYETWSEKGANRSASQHYDTLDNEALCRLPVKDLADKQATLLIWATIPKLPEAFDVIEAWGFTYRSAIVWAKMSRAAAPRMGLGYHARNMCELLLIAQRGDPGAPEVSERPDGLMFCPIGRHSAKPDYQYDAAENYDGPYLELFHRPRGGMFGPRPDWTFVGNEVDGLDIREALRRLAHDTPPCPTAPATGDNE